VPYFPLIQLSFRKPQYSVAVNGKLIWLDEWTSFVGTFLCRFKDLRKLFFIIFKPQKVTQRFWFKKFFTIKIFSFAPPGNLEVVLF